MRVKFSSHNLKTTMPMFVKKFPNSGDTTHIRIPSAYKDVIEELMIVFDQKFKPEQGVHLLRKYINNFQ